MQFYNLINQGCTSLYLEVVARVPLELVLKILAAHEPLAQYCLHSWILSIESSSGSNTPALPNLT